MCWCGCGIPLLYWKQPGYFCVGHPSLVGSAQLWTCSLPWGIHSWGENEWPCERELLVGSALMKAVFILFVSHRVQLFYSSPFSHGIRCWQWTHENTGGEELIKSALGHAMSPEAPTTLRWVFRVPFLWFIKLKKNKYRTDFFFPCCDASIMKSEEQYIVISLDGLGRVDPGKIVTWHCTWWGGERDEIYMWDNVDELYWTRIRIARCKWELGSPHFGPGSVRVTKRSVWSWVVLSQHSLIVVVCCFLHHPCIIWNLQLS